MGGGVDKSNQFDRKSLKPAWVSNLHAFIAAAEEDDDEAMANVLVGGAKGKRTGQDGFGGKPPLPGGKAPSQGGGKTAGAVVPSPQKQKGTATVDHKYGCLWCGQNHHHTKCGKVADMPVLERWSKMRQRMRNETICVSCLEEGHKSTGCAKGCGISGCLRRHATLLHMDYPATEL